VLFTIVDDRTRMNLKSNYRKKYSNVETSLTGIMSSKQDHVKVSVTMLGRKAEVVEKNLMITVEAPIASIDSDEIYHTASSGINRGEIFH
jgi:hypothetical protein